MNVLLLLEDREYGLLFNERRGDSAKCFLHSDKPLVIQRKTEYLVFREAVRLCRLFWPIGFCWCARSKKQNCFCDDLG